MTVLAIATAVVWLLTLSFVLQTVRARGLLRKLRRLVAAALCLSLGILLGSVLVLQHLFRAFAGETLVARVSTVRLGAEEFELRYQPIQNVEEPAQTLRLRGDQWSISGGVIKWHPWVTMLGVKSYHRPMRLSGQFSRLARQRAEPPSVHPLAPEPDAIWEALYRVSRYLPVVDAVYGSAAYVYAEPKAVQEIYVTHSGYIIKRTSRSPD